MNTFLDIYIVMLILFINTTVEDLLSRILETKGFPDFGSLQNSESPIPHPKSGIFQKHKNNKFKIIPCRI